MAGALFLKPTDQIHSPEIVSSKVMDRFFFFYVYLGTLLTIKS